MRISPDEQGLSHGALTAYRMAIPPSTAQRTRTNRWLDGSRGKHLGKDLLSLRSADTPTALASCAGHLMKGDTCWQLADSPTPAGSAGVLTQRSPAVRVTSGRTLPSGPLLPRGRGQGHPAKHLIWQLSLINKHGSITYILDWSNVEFMSA